MDKAAQTLMEEYPDIVLAFGESDEFRYVNIPQDTQPYHSNALFLASCSRSPANYTTVAKGKHSARAYTIQYSQSFIEQQDSLHAHLSLHVCLRIPLERILS